MSLRVSFTPFARSRAGVAAGLAAACCALATIAAAQTPAKPEAPAVPLSAATVEFFEKEVRPVLAQSCYACHGAKKQQGGLRLDSRAFVLHGGANGPSAVPGDPAKSLLVKAVHHDDRVMPPGKKLPAKQIAALEKWVQMGLPWPGDGSKQPAPKGWEQILKDRRVWWSLNAVRNVTPPAVKATPQTAAWAANPIDRFVLQSLTNKGLKPAVQADKVTLIRRLYLSVIGLPPTTAEVDAFVADKSPKAYEKVVDRVLASPHFGERWARHWMDVVRFGENHGYEWNYEIRDPWRYRDYLIRAFNADVPYDHLIREHIAGDLIGNPRINRQEQLNESVIGTAFYRFGEAGHDVFKEIGLDVLDNQIDTLTKAFQAVTVSCARCHDHKLDAVSQKDYYALLGILGSSRQVVKTIDTPERFAPVKEQLKRLKVQIREETVKLWRTEAQDFGRYLRASRDPAADATGLNPARLNQWKAVLSTAAKGLEDPASPWQALVKSGGEASKAWKELAEKYAAESKTRTDFNQKNFTVLADFTNGQTNGWRVTGPGLADGPVKPGDFAVALEGDKLVQTVFPAGLFTNSLSWRLNGSVVAPDWKDLPLISVEASGGKEATVRTVPDFRTLTDTGREIKSETPSWITMSKSDRDERVYIELNTKLDMGRLERDQRQTDSTQDDQRSYFGITRAVAHRGGETPKDELKSLLPLFKGSAPQNAEEAADRFGAFLRTAVDDWATGETTDAEVPILNWILQKGLLSNTQAATPKLAQLTAEYRKVEATMPAPRRVDGVGDQSSTWGFDHPVYIRGDFHQVGQPSPRRYLEVLSSDQGYSPAGSGRLQLAESIADAKNPLTSRVMVNRVWHWLFGTGIVRSVDDFGHVGEKPSHPELLDYLARTFVSPASRTPNTQRLPPGLAWSTKNLIRAIVTSETFKQSSQADPKAMAVEPENRLLHHFPVVRAEAEVIRDSILAVSGRLDPKLFGPSIHPYRFQEKGDRKLYSGPLDSDGRRSVYTRITLMEGAPFLGVFNQPEAKVMQGRRDVTNVPAQALALLNDPFVLQQAVVWATKEIKQNDPTPAVRIERMFRQLVARKPSASEVARFEKLTQELVTLNDVKPEEVMTSNLLWKDVAHALMNVKEFIYIR